MRAIAFFLFAALVLVGGGSARPASAAGGAAGHESDPPLPLVVSPAWLGEHGGDQGVVILHMAYTRREYLREHIAGARFLWFYDLVRQTPEAMTDLPPKKQVESVLESLGVSDDSRIVLCYGGNAFVGAARIFYTFDAYGLGGRTAILDGGLEAWKRENRPVTSEQPAVRRGKLSLRLRPECTVDAEAVKQRLGDTRVALVDARSKQAFDGVNQPRVLRPGHIAGATSLPVAQVTDSLGCVKDSQALTALFEGAGAGAGKEVVTYCGVGQSAAGVYFAARLLGLPVRLYDGSMDDWIYRDDSYPVEVSPPPPAPAAAPPSSSGSAR